MPRIPTYRRVATIPGPESMAMPRATAAAFGGLEGRAMEIGGKEISSTYGILGKEKATKAAQIYANKVVSDMRAHFAERAVILRRTTDGDIAPVLDTEMKDQLAIAQTKAPNQAAYEKVTMGLRTMFGTMRAREIGADSVYQDERLIQSDESAHESDKSAVYNSPSLLYSTIEATKKRINNLAIDPTTKRDKLNERIFALGEASLRGSIESSEKSARAVLQELQDPAKNEDIAKYLKQSDKDKLIRYANTTIKTHEADAWRLKTQARQEHTDNQRDIKEDLMMMFADPKQAVTMEIIRNYTLDNGAKPDGGTLSFFYNLLRISASGEPKPSEEDRVASYEGTLQIVDELVSKPNKHSWDMYATEDLIDDRVLSRHLPIPQGKFLRKRLRADFDARRTLLEKLYKNRITKSNKLTGLTDIRGDELYMQAFAKIDDILDEAEEKKTPLAPLFDPTKPEYIGKQLEEFVRTPTEIIKDMQKQMGIKQSKSPKDEKDTIEAIRKILKEKFGIQF